MITPKVRTNPYNRVTPATTHTHNRIQPSLLSSRLTFHPTSIFGGTKETSVSTLASINDNRKIAHQPPTNIPTNHATRTEEIPPSSTIAKKSNGKNNTSIIFSNTSGMNMRKDNINPHYLVQNILQGDNLPKSTVTAKKLDI